MTYDVRKSNAISQNALPARAANFSGERPQQGGMTHARCPLSAAAAAFDADAGGVTFVLSSRGRIRNFSPGRVRGIRASSRRPSPAQTR